jgi:hypothetical protein
VVDKDTKFGAVTGDVHVVKVARVKISYVYATEENRGLRVSVTD